MRVGPVRAAAAVVTLLLVVSACTGSSSKAPSASPSATSSTTPPPTTSTPKPKPKPKPRPKKPPARNPFTGIGPVPKDSVISVKIDDTEGGRPQRGIDYADIVYIEAVEGGLTRLAAIFGTYKPTVGYVRSTRPSDPDLLLQFGRITAVYSGGAHDSLPLIHRSGIKSWSMDGGHAYFLRRSHPNDHGYINVLARLTLIARHVHTTRPRSIGWTFSRTLSGFHARRSTTIRTSVTGSYSHGTPVEFRWDRRLKKYIRYIDGRPQKAADGRWVSATNVIVQSCRVVSHPRDSDVLGNPSQFTYTIGHGRVAIFRQGERINGTWSRPHSYRGTVFRASNGKVIPLEPGNTWVVLVRNGVPVVS